MNLKEFDAKQFMLEKGERVGLGVALTLMVLMLIFSLFMPSGGLFSPSPVKNAAVLKEGSDQLQTALNTAQPGPNDKPGTSEGKLIDLDTRALASETYELGGWFESTRSGEQGRRPPTILNVDQAVAVAAHIPVDGYLFTSNFKRITILKDPERGNRNTSPGPGRGSSSMSRMYQGASAGNPRQRGRFSSNAGQIQGAEEKPEYIAQTVDLEKLDPSAHLARQLRPARMAIIAGSFPLKAQVEEFKSKLRLSSLQDVFYDTVEENKDNKLNSFRFLGVQVQRQELDAHDKVVSDWSDLNLSDSYKIWLLYSGLPFEVDDPKYAPIEWNGLVMPLLREFHEESPQNAMAMMGGPPMSPGGRSPAPQEAPRKEGESKYPDLAGQVPNLKTTLAALADAGPKSVAAPPSQFQTKDFDPFNPTPPAAEDANNPMPSRPPTTGPGDNAPEMTIPEHCLVRLVDVTIEPGKFYRYRFKVKMANPNYNNPNVASPAYKTAKELASEKWYELPQTVRVPTERFYYVVDQKVLSPKEKVARESPLNSIWYARPDLDRQAVFQFHRWIESTPIIPDGEPVPIGDWAIADRVFVARGEYVGQTVKVDLPVWKYTQDSFVIPTEDQRKRVRGKVPTGVHVNFGADNPDSETILVDFEGGLRQYEPGVAGAEGAAKPAKISDTSGVEVLMISPDGKLLARNSATDSGDEERKGRRESVRQRIEQVKSGKAGGPAGGAGGLDVPR